MYMHVHALFRDHRVGFIADAFVALLGLTSFFKTFMTPSSCLSQVFGAIVRKRGFGMLRDEV